MTDNQMKFGFLVAVVLIACLFVGVLLGDIERERSCTSKNGVMIESHCMVAIDGKVYEVKP